MDSQVERGRSQNIIQNAMCVFVCCVSSAIWAAFPSIGLDSPLALVGTSSARGEGEGKCLIFSLFFLVFMTIPGYSSQ